MENYKLSRRDALKGLGAAFGIAAVGGCRSFEAYDPINDKVYNRLVDNSLATTVEGFIKASTDAFVKPVTPKTPQFAWHDHTDVIGKEIVGGLDYLSTLNKSVADVLAGYPVLFRKTALALYNSKDVRDSLNMSDDAKKVAAEDFTKTLTKQQSDLLEQTSSGFADLITGIGNLRNYEGRLARIRSQQVGNEALDKEAKELAQAFSTNASQLQAYLTAQQSLLVGEGAWNSPYTQRNINIHDGLQTARGNYGFLKLGENAEKRVVSANGKETTIGDLLQDAGKNASDYFSKQPAQFLDKINQNVRHPVASAAFKQLYAQGKMPAEEHQGVIHQLDNKILLASTTQVNGAYNTLATLVRFLPGVTFVDGIVNGAAYMGTPNSPEGSMTKVLDSTLKNYFGASSASWRVGDEDPTLRFAMAMIITAIEAGLLAYGIKASRSSSSSGQSGVGVGGGQTGGPGLR